MSSLCKGLKEGGEGETSPPTIWAKNVFGQRDSKCESLEGAAFLDV